MTPLNTLAPSSHTDRSDPTEYSKRVFRHYLRKVYSTYGEPPAMQLDTLTRGLADAGWHPTASYPLLQALDSAAGVYLEPHRNRVVFG